MNNPQIYQSDQFGKIRVLYEDGKPLFCGRDVCKALGYTDPTNAMKLHCRGVAKRHLIDSKGRNQQANFLPEGDVYRLITHSKLPTAEQFERWVFDEVLPSIRQTGQYNAQKQADTYTRYLRISNSQMVDSIQALSFHKARLREYQEALDNARTSKEKDLALAQEWKRIYKKDCELVRRWENVVRGEQNAVDKAISALEQFMDWQDVFSQVPEISSDELTALFSPVLNEMTAQAAPAAK